MTDKLAEREGFEPPVERGANSDRQRGNTKEENSVLGLLNEGFRIRDLDSGTWLTPDPAGFIDGTNMYTYVVQNPWTKFDPEGLSTWSNTWKGDFDEEETTWSGVAVQVGVGIVPGIGQVADARDTAANIRNVWKSPGTATEWAGLAAAVVGWVPGFGDGVKGAYKVGKKATTQVAKKALIETEQEVVKKAEKQVFETAKKDIEKAAETRIGYHATLAKAVDGIKKEGFEPGTAAGRLGSGGTYVNSTPEGAIAEFINRNANAAPFVLKVQYKPGIEAITNVAPRNYVEKLPLNVDTITAPSVRLPGTTNTHILNASAEVVE